MKMWLRYILITVLLFFVSYYIWISLADAAYGDKWKYRVGSSDRKESVNRGVFVKDLNFSVNSPLRVDSEFDVFIEKGYRFGRHTTKKTLPLVGSNFPYQLQFNNRPNLATTIRIKKDQLSKFDSSDGCCWGYLRIPKLPDTIYLEVLGYNNSVGTIKVW